MIDRSSRTANEVAQQRRNFSTDLKTLGECEEKLGELFEELMAELAQKEADANSHKDFRETEVCGFYAHNRRTRRTHADAGKLSHASDRGVRPHRKKRAIDGRRCAFCGSCATR